MSGMFLSDPGSIIALSLGNSLTHWLFLSLIVTVHIQSLLMLMVTLYSHSLSGFLAFYQQYVSSCFLKFRIRLLLSRGAARRCTNKTWNTKHSRVDIINLIKKMSMQICLNCIKLFACWRNWDFYCQAGAQTMAMTEPQSPVLFKNIFQVTF